MLLELLAVLLTWLVPDAAAAGLARTAPEPMPLPVARAHLARAALASAVHRVDPALVLAIAAHESHYDEGAVTPEPGGLYSCGVMTPVPGAPCRPQTVLEGYLAGAAHLRGWIGGPGSPCHGNLRCALLGYAGGGERGLIGACKAGPVHLRPGVDTCSIAEVFLARARWIRREAGISSPES